MWGEGLIVAVCLAGGVVSFAPTTQAVPMLCEHREPGHIDRHGGVRIDNRWHRNHDQRITCQDTVAGSDSHAGGRNHDEGGNTTEHKKDDRISRDTHHWWEGPVIGPRLPHNKWHKQ